MATLHAAALAAALATLQGWPRGLVAAGVFFSGLVSVLHALQAWPGAIREIELQPDYALRWRDGDRDWQTGMVAPGPYVSPWLILMRIVTGSGARRWLVLGPDSAGEEDLWALRLRLKDRRQAGRSPHNHTAG